VVLALAMLSCTAIAQGGSKQNIGSAGSTARKTVTLIGNVSQDRMFVHDNDDQVWAVSNPGALKGYEGTAVVVRAYLNASQNRIHVVSVKADRATYSARTGDSAFRR
jgi:hypothetical protein